MKVGGLFTIEGMGSKSRRNSFYRFTAFWLDSLRDLSLITGGGGVSVMVEIQSVILQIQNQLNVVHFAFLSGLKGDYEYDEEREVLGLPYSPCQDMETIAL